jgi:hypothetical protein
MDLITDFHALWVRFIDRIEGLSKIGACIGFFLAYFLPVQELIYSVVFLVLADAFTGIWKNIKNEKTIRDKCRKIESGRLKTTVSKMVLYSLIILILFVIEQSLLGASTIYLAKVGASMALLVELKSIAENVDMILGANTFSGLYQKIKAFFKRRGL